MSIHRLLARALLCLAAAPLAARRGARHPCLRRRVYGLAFYQQTAERFEALHPGLKILLYGDPRIEDKLRMRVIDGHYPDAASLAYINWPALIRAGKVLDPRPLALAGPNWEGDARWGDTFQPGALEGWRIGGRIYGLPLSYSCWTIFYNRGLFTRRTAGPSRAPGMNFSPFVTRCMRRAIAPVLSLPGTRWLYPDAILRAAYYNLAGAAGLARARQKAT